MANSERRMLIDVALGHLQADLVIRGGRLVNVFTREIYPADIAIKGDRVASVGNLPTGAVGTNTEVIDAQGLYLVPGLIDQHSHTYESHLSVGAYAELVLPHGTTVQCADFYGEAVVGGVDAVRLSLDIAKTTPLKFIFVLPLPACYQNGKFGNTGLVTFEDMKRMASWKECRGINDTFAARVVAKDPDLLALIEHCQSLGQHVCGHASELSGRLLQAWMAFVRNSDDHECVAPEEAVEKARSGVWISMREGSGCYNTAALSKAITEYGVDPRRFTFNTDLISPLEVATKGHIDQAVRVAIQHGINPLVAIQMATINAAECLGISDEHGAISPGKYADVLFVEDLASFRVRGVIASGRRVAWDGQMLEPVPLGSYPPWARNTVRLGDITVESLAIPASVNNGKVNARVILAHRDSLITDELHESLDVRNGVILADPDRDILKIVSIERHKGHGQLGKAFIRGFGLKEGAIAGTYNPQHQDLLAVGTNDEDILVAARAIEHMGGGFAVVSRGCIVESLPLPLFGLLSDQRPSYVVGKLERLYSAVHRLGSSLPAPFHTLAFVGLPVDIGRLKISHMGLVDVWNGALVDVEV